jgi:glycerophosphoryl diester phosphodiesterase
MSPGSEPPVERRLYGHRGAPAHFPENSLAAFERALDDGATALETDVHLTRDGHFVAIHDPDGARVAGRTERVADLDLAEVKRWQLKDPSRPDTVHRVPTLVEVMDAFPGVSLSVDLKQADPDVVEPMLELLASRSDGGRVSLCSFHDRQIDRVLALGWDGPTALSRREVAILRLAPWLARRSRYRGRTAQIPRQSGPFRLDGRSFLERCRWLGVRVDFWVVDDPADGRELLDRGARGLMSDDPGRLAHLFR